MNQQMYPHVSSYSIPLAVTIFLSLFPKFFEWFTFLRFGLHISCLLNAIFPVNFQQLQSATSVSKIDMMFFYLHGLSNSPFINENSNIMMPKLNGSEIMLSLCSIKSEFLFDIFFCVVQKSLPCSRMLPLYHNTEKSFSS